MNALLGSVKRLNAWLIYTFGVWVPRLILQPFCLGGEKQGKSGCILSWRLLRSTGFKLQTRQKIERTQQFQIISIGLITKVKKTGLAKDAKRTASELSTESESRSVTKGSYRFFKRGTGVKKFRNKKVKGEVYLLITATYLTMNLRMVSNIQCSPVGFLSSSNSPAYASQLLGLQTHCHA